MNEEEILRIWKQGLNKNKVAKIYMRQYNQRIKIVRLDMKHRHEKFMTYYEALARVERIILKEVEKNWNKFYL